MFSLKTILVPIDFYEPSRAALDAATAIAAKFGAKVIAMHVIPPPALASVAGMPVPPDVDQRDPSAVSKELAELTAGFGGPILKVVHQGDAGSFILKEAVDSDCDLIVMGTAGRTGIVRAILGSVAEYVSRRAPCPVLLIKSQREEVSPQRRAESTQAVQA